MKHPEAFLIPVLIFLDYFLTVLGSVQRAKVRGAVKIQHYELNPIWQKAIAQKKWFNPAHILLTIGISSLLICAINYGDLPDEFIDSLSGFLIVLFATVVGRHVSNLLTFNYRIRNQNTISGQGIMPHRAVLILSSYPYLTVLFPVVLIAAFSGSYFAYGGVIGICGFLFLQFVWWLRAGKQIVKPAGQVTKPRFLLCIDDNGLPESLEKRKFYEVLDDSAAAAEGMVRVIDETGEDYLYPRSCFANIVFSEQIERMLEAT